MIEMLDYQKRNKLIEDYYRYFIDVKNNKNKRKVVAI